MIKRQLERSYGAVSRLNHWVIALAMIGMICYGLFIVEFLPKGPEKYAQIQTHKALGVLVLVYGVWRVLWRLLRGFPEPASAMPLWQRRLSEFTHWALIVGILLMPLSGMTTSLFGGHDISMFGSLVIPGLPVNETVSKLAADVHAITGKVLIAIIALHVAGALKHHLIDRDATLIRMLSGKVER
ncbi:MAG: cytochrome b [Pseudomonadota bacterium]